MLNKKIIKKFSFYALIVLLIFSLPLFEVVLNAIKDNTVKHVIIMYVLAPISLLIWAYFAFMFIGIIIDAFTKGKFSLRINKKLNDIKFFHFDNAKASRYDMSMSIKEWIVWSFKYWQFCRKK